MLVPQIASYQNLKMLIDTEHIHHWMNAIRMSEHPQKTLEAFWRGQILSKEWLIEELQKITKQDETGFTINIHGGWVGTLASLIFQSQITTKRITSIDIDPTCAPIAKTMNQIEFDSKKFDAITHNMCNFTNNADIEINTSFEHVTQLEYEQWLSNINPHSIVVIQSNNFNIPEHVRIADTLNEFKTQAKISSILFAGELNLPLYKRFMIIGKK